MSKKTSRKYLLDTNVCIFMLQDKFGVADYVRRVGRRNCYVSELTVAELLYGYAYCQDSRNEHDAEIIQEVFKLLPIFITFDFALLISKLITKNLLPLKTPSIIPPKIKSLFSQMILQ